MSEIEVHELPSTDFNGTLEIMDFSIPCAVIYPFDKKPQRVLVQREIVGLLTGNKKGGFERYLKPKNLQPYLPEKFQGKSLEESTIKFRFKNMIAQGFLATDLIDICEMYIRARRDGKLLQTQDHLATQSEIIITAFAKTGIIAVIDEVTGYQAFRSRDAMEKILNQLIADELKPWIKTFPDEFYEQYFRLRNWQYKPFNVKRPGIVGKDTNDLIYDRMAPLVLSKLKESTPRNEKGKLKYHYHRRFTEDIGDPKLREHISNVIVLMKASANWRNFLSLVNRALPRYGDTIPMDLEN